jgi:transcriptional regulator with PAS, ATPase and Fis domain
MLLNSPNEAGTGHQQQQNIPEPDPMAMENVFDLHGIGKVGFFSKEMQDLMGKAIKLHENKSSAVLIQGETGTGKEIIASLIHYGKNCPPAEETPLICVNCSAISPNLFESEFFGYEGGAFTGADPKGKAGKLELAANGTLFLDEIADMPLDFQPKLLRVLEDRRFFRISGNKELSFNARVICATNNHLLEMVNNGKFRKDLYYRLNTAILQIPPLRERKDDIIPLAYLFLEEFRPKDSKKLSTITEGAREILQNLKWDGNIRELHSTMERIAFNYNDSFLQAAHVESMVDEYVEGNKNFFYLELSEEGVNLQEVIDLFISRVIDMHNGNITKTAEYLKTSRNLVKRRGGK